MCYQRQTGADSGPGRMGTTGKAQVSLHCDGCTAVCSHNTDPDTLDE